MNKKLTDYVIDLVEILNKQQKQVFWGIFDILSMVVSIIVLWPYKSCACRLCNLHSFSLPPLSNHDCILGAKC